MSLEHIRNLVWKEFLQLARDRLLTLFLFLLPAVQLVLLARATGRGIHEQPVVILDLDRTAVTRELALRLDLREELAVEYFVDTEEDLRRLLEEGEARMGIIFPAGLSARLLDPTQTASVRVVVDGTNDVVAGIILSAVQALFTEYAQEQAAAWGLRVAPLLDLRIVTYYNPGYDTRQFAIPAQVGFITYQITLAIASLGLARERELGTLEGLIVTPMRRAELIVGKAIPALVIGLLNFLFLLAIAILGFGVPLRGSFWLLLGLTVAFVLAEVGWGLMISGFSRTQQQALLFVFIQALVDLTLSGYLVPVKNLPLALRAASRVVPMYHYLVVIRSVMLKGAGLADLWPHALALVGLAGLVLFIAARRVSRRLE
ncbi:MAG: ABC transporter permease [Anaerolineae bacterium]|nr:ABC transporter permease [Anaerolineae bacterium]